jgi:hypothetical protein
VQFVKDKKLIVFRSLSWIAYVQTKGAMVLFSRGMNQILTKHMAGNKSGALLLTIFALTTGAGTNGLP